MIAPLLYGKQNLGLLALGNGPLGTPFTQSDFVVFKSISEQSAFALYNAIIYSEANEKKRLDHDLEIARDIPAHSLRKKRPPWRVSRSAASTFRRGRSAAITSIPFVSMISASALPLLRCLPARAFRLR